MKKNILLTTLDVPGNDRSPGYYSARNEFGYDYCEALQSIEAGTKLMLARVPVDEILIIGDEVLQGDMDSQKSIRLKDSKNLSQEEGSGLSALDLYKCRLARYIDEISRDEKAYDTLLPEEVRNRLIKFIGDFQEQYSERETKRLNRFFDELSENRVLYKKFCSALFNEFPELDKESGHTMQWVKYYLYTQLKPSLKLECLEINEGVSFRYIPAEMLEKREYWVSILLNTDPADTEGEDEINLYVSLGNDSAIDGQILLNMLDILISTPGSNVQLKKIYKVTESSDSLTGQIEDSTVLSKSTELVTAAHAFLNYSKTDLLVKFWENSGGQDDRISKLIYGARHVDVGISMCNIPEVQEGIDRLRSLFRDEASWKDEGEYGLLFGMIAGCIKADYKNLLEGDGSIKFLELIKWAYKHQLYQQVLTLIEAHAPANIVNSGIFFYCDDETKADDIIKILALRRLEMKPYEYYKLDDIEHYFIKNYDRDAVRLMGTKDEDRNLIYAGIRTGSINDDTPDKIAGHTACSSIESVQKVLYAYYHLGEVRNKISHADSRAMAESRLIVYENDISSAMLVMRETIEYFINSYEASLEEVKGKAPNIVIITPEEVRKTADMLKRGTKRHM